MEDIMGSIKNVIVMMFDSWQFNYTGCYGNDWIKTPNIDRLAREGVLFENAYGNNMPTLPVRRSLMTGRYGLHEVGWGPLRPEDTTIADMCWGTGVDTAIAYNSLVMFCRKTCYARGFATAVFTRGFDNYHYKDQLYGHYTVEEFLDDPGFLERLRASADGAIVERVLREELESYLRDRQFWKKPDQHSVATNMHAAIKILKERDRKHPLLMWIDCWDPHEPWDPMSVWTGEDCPYDKGYGGADMWMPPHCACEGVFTEAQLNHIRMLYAETVTLCDTYFGELCDFVDSDGMWDNTLMWLTSDHGEPMGFGEHGHGIMGKCRPWPYEELVHIPLIIKAPGLPAGKRIKAFVQDCDCAPTLLDWLGLDIPPNMTGKSLVPLMRGEVEKVRDFAIAGYYNLAWSIIEEKWSYIHWLEKLDNKSYGETMVKMYNGADKFKQMATEEENASAKEYMSQRSVDGADQWTCTPASKVEVPQGDELYDREKDPFQLHNVIAEHPDVAGRMLKTLNLFMQDLAAM